MPKRTVFGVVGEAPKCEFDALRVSSRQSGSSVGASVPMMSIETATSAPEVDVAAPGPFDLGRDRVSGPCFGLDLRTMCADFLRLDGLGSVVAVAPDIKKV